MASVQSIFTSLYSNDKIDFSKLNRKQSKLVYDIIKCKTAKCGFNKDVCEHCGDTQIHYNSCKNPYCPQCQAVKREV